ncbi:MAG: glycosyltransferase family 2 protein [Elusimicrobiaceae bacterium]|nr:glycosyltransferase family 2 protein [Elusimicrobiaceae bacterium]
MTANRISLFIITKNEAEHLAKCILSAKPLVHEIIVVDSNSTDRTTAIARNLGAIIYNHSFEGFTQQKNVALSKVTSDWALSLDADETLTPELAEEIKQAVTSNEIDGYELTRVNDFLGKHMRHSGIKKEYLLRLVRTSKACFKGGLVHEKLCVEGKTARLKNVFVHHPYKDIETYFNKFNKYTTLAAEQMFNNGRHVNLLRVLLTVPFEFVRRYIFQLGFLDGMRGLIWAAFAGFYVFVKYMKLWYLWERKKWD